MDVDLRGQRILGMMNVEGKDIHWSAFCWVSHNNFNGLSLKDPCKILQDL